MFIYLEGTYNYLKGNTVILGTIIVIDAQLKMSTVSIICKKKTHCDNMNEQVSNSNMIQNIHIDSE
jgi:hypothetical protein